ncbi:MAG: PQQ-dependent sugar dehydrogenase [Planctomycetes bacterium]|nr:PQQ-dependent sugar dehydrogenase [Planctomycetota bacterium]
MSSSSGLVASIVASAIALCATISAQTPPAGFTYEQLSVGGLASATAMAFLPDGRLLITERETGNIRLFRAGALQAAPWATIPVYSGGPWSEAGLLGIAVDPAFLDNHYVYVYHTVAGGGSNTITRLEEQNGVGVGATQLIPNGQISANLYHNGGAMVVGFDGRLYVATGDAQAGASAQDTNQWVGKVLRFALPDLTVPSDNPFPGSPVWSYGHRNHFGLAVHPVNGDVYQTENGGALMDEVNRILPGGNYGWPIVEGNEATPNPALIDPLAWYQPTTAPTGTCFYTGDHYPSALRNAWFFTDYNQNKLRVLYLDAAGSNVVSSALFDQRPGSGYGIVSGPDGNLWYLTNDNGGYGADQLGRYVHANEPAASVQLSSVSQKTLGASATVAVHAHDGLLCVSWLSLSRYPVPLPTPFGNVWVPGDAPLSVQAFDPDHRAYVGFPVPNLPAFLGSSLHTQAVVVDVAGQLTMTSPSDLVIRG